jgi:hypothetical protein
MTEKDMALKNRSKQTNTFFILVLLGLVYFIAFIPPNLTGARDVNMLSVFQHDEFAQYPHVIRMLTPGDTIYQSLRNFVVYLHYYYGYPFYFLSALFLLPVTLFIGSGWAQHTSTIVAVLRQSINVLPIILATLILVWLQTKLINRAKALVIFILLLTLPAVVDNNMWWHPDSLLVLFTVLTLFFLARDDFRFGKDFFLSAVPLGLAIGVKILGVLFVVTYAVYFLYSLFSHRISLKKAVIFSSLFLALLIFVVVATNPLLLLPIERGEIIEDFKILLQENTIGFWVKGNTDVSMFQQITQLYSSKYTSFFLLLISFAGLVYSFNRKETQALGLLIFTWAIGYLGYFLFFAATLRSHYLLPVALPVLSSLAVFLPGRLLPEKNCKWVKYVAALVLLAGVVVQICANIVSGLEEVQSVINRESNSTSIQLYRDVNTELLSRLNLDRKVRIYRDWRAYVAQQDKYHIIYNWKLATYSYIQEINPDVIFLELENMRYFSDPAKVQVAIDPTRMEEMVAFYSDALNGQLVGYRLVKKTDFGSVFVKDDLYWRYLSE